MTVDLYLGDCLEVMKSIPDKSVDAIITDLPYGTTACSWDEIIPFEPMWKEVKRICKGVFVTTASQPFTSKLVMSSPDLFKYELIWNKLSSGAFGVAKFRPLPTHENILLFGYANTTYNKQTTHGKPYHGKNTPRKYSKYGNEHGFGFKDNGKNFYDGVRNPVSVLTINSQSAECNNTNRRHPTQKPVALYEYLIRTYTNEGDTVLDICAGSGTTGVACVNTNRNFIGIELREDYYKIMETRIADAQLQMGLPI